MSQQNVSSKKISIEFLKARIKELETLVETQSEFIGKLTKELEDIKLPQLIKHAEPLADEELVVLDQIKRLRAKAVQGELTLDEVRKLDLLVKNKSLIQGKDIRVPFTDVSELPEARLLELAQGKTKNE